VNQSRRESCLKNFQQKTRDEKKPEEERLKKLTQSMQNPHAWVTTGTQGIFAYPQGDSETGDWNSNTLKGAFRLIVQTLLRLAIGF
jgi:hypothetical protein